jgi:hypothetical protein
MTPKTFYPVDVVTALGKFILTVINTKMLAIADIDEAVVATPSVRVDNAFQLYFAAYNRL